MAEDLGEKTEAPTGRKISDARERGQVAKSPDLSGAIDLIGAAALLITFGTSLVTNLAGLMRAILSGEAPGAGDAGAAGLDALFLWTAGHALRVLLPLMAVMFAAVYAGQLMQVQFLFSTQPLVPKLERLDPIAGFGRVFGRRGVVKTAVGFIKLLLVGGVAGSIIVSSIVDLAGLPRLTLVAGFARVGEILFDMAKWILLLMLIIGLGDFWYQRWQYTRDLRMTKQEVKDERKSMDGDMELKGRRLRMARQMILQRMRQDVPKADVIVTNPTHFAVALRYDPSAMSAPKVVAKGADYMAFRIREIATTHGVPIVEKPALARALYASAEVGQSIRPEYFEAVAEILAYVYRLAGKAA